MEYSNDQTHIENNHPKHSQAHAYSFSGEYLGNKKDLELVGGIHFDCLESNGASVIYNHDTCGYTVHHGWLTGNLITDTYEVILTQNLVILGYRRIK